MQVQARAKTQNAVYDGSDVGEGLSIFLSQGPAETARYRFIVKAETNEGLMVVGEVFSSPPSATTPAGQPQRMIACAVCPGAKGWSVDIQCVDPEPPDEVCRIYLASSKCCTSPAGVNRVGERYLYVAGDQIGGATSFAVPPGRRMTSWSATAKATDGSVQLSANTADIITVPAGMSVSAEPGAGLIAIENITFTNVIFFVEFLESA